jgi:hypothetical protein
VIEPHELFAIPSNFGFTYGVDKRMPQQHENANVFALVGPIGSHESGLAIDCPLKTTHRPNISHVSHPPIGGGSVVGHRPFNIIYAELSFDGRASIGRAGKPLTNEAILVKIDMRALLMMTGASESNDKVDRASLGLAELRYAFGNINAATDFDQPIFVLQQIKVLSAWPNHAAPQVPDNLVQGIAGKDEQVVCRRPLTGAFAGIAR